MGTSRATLDVSWVAHTVSWATHKVRRGTAPAAAHPVGYAKPRRQIRKSTAGASHVITAENAGCGALWLGYPWWG